MLKTVMLETDRLILRRYCESDFEDLYEYLSDEEVVKYEPYKPMNVEEVKGNLMFLIKHIGGWGMQKKVVMQ